MNTYIKLSSKAAAYLGIPTHVRFDPTNWRFLRSDLDAYLERHRSVAKTLFEKK
jgi:hypothetical protein